MVFFSFLFSGEKCTDCFTKNDTLQLIGDKYGDYWWEPLDRKACHYGVGPFNVTQQTADFKDGVIILKDLPMVWTDPDTGAACVNNQKILSWEGKLDSAASEYPTYQCAYTAIADRNKRADGEKGTEREVVDDSKGKGPIDSKGKVDGADLIDWYRNPALAVANGYAAADYEGFFNNETKLWVKQAEHMFNWCGNDNQAKVNFSMLKLYL